MKKKLLYGFILLVLFMVPIQGFAIELNDNLNFEIPQTMTGYLLDEAGSLVTVTGYLVTQEDISLYGLLDDETNLTYAFTLYSGPNYTLTAEDTDGSMSVRVYLTIRYTTQNTPTEYLLTNVSGSWDILDSKVTVYNAELTYGCSGILPFPTTQSATHTVTNNFNYNTGFTDYIIQNYGYMGANINLYLRMGSQRTWEFFMQNNLF